MAWCEHVTCMICCCYNLYDCYCNFFFQAEDGIRDYKVTGVQTCALPIFSPGKRSSTNYSHETQLVLTVAAGKNRHRRLLFRHSARIKQPRSEERRVGKECRSRWSPLRL